MSIRTVTAISDLHGQLPNNIPQCDLLLIAGDVCPTIDHSISFQAIWLRGNFWPWLKDLQKNGTIRYAAFIAGNHDFFFQGYKQENHSCFTNDDYPMKGTTGLYYLEDNSVTIEGLKVWGCPWSLRFHDWAFNADETELVERYARIPKGIDILLSHGPAYGYGDLAPRSGARGDPADSEKVGSPALLKKVLTDEIKLVVYGHIHEGYGKYHVANSILLNASYMDGRYRPVNKPWLLDYNENGFSVRPS